MGRIYEALQVEEDFIKAMERKEFRLYYQPKLDLVSGKIIGVEALVRWEHPEKGLLPPLEFIPFAENSGLIIPLGEWILRTACLQIKEWQESGYVHMLMSVNLSAPQLYQPEFADKVQQILTETKLTPKFLNFEITEGVMLDAFQAPKVIRELKGLGVQISLDDFGTGFNSFHYLQELPIDTIKIDQSFVQNCYTDLNDGTIVKSIIEMAHQLQMNIVAEGIYSADQLIFLQQNHCNIGQGYLFSKPLPPDELMKQIDNIEQIVIQKGIPQEVSHQKLYKEMIERTRQDLRDTVRLQQGVIFKFKKIDGKFIHTLSDGKLLYRMGISLEHVIGKELKDIIPFADAVKKERYYQRAWNGEQNITFDGEFNGIAYLTSLTPIRRGGVVTEVIGSTIDITEQKQLTASLRLRESQYRIITENTQDLIRVIDTNYRLEYASPSHELILGYPPEAYEGHLIFEMMHPDDHQRVENIYANAIQSKAPIETEIRLKHVNGYWIDFELKATPVLDESNEVKQIVIVARDISERKKTERFIRKSEKLSIVGQLATSVAHEIRNPLTTIKGFVQLLQKEIDKPIYLNTMLAEIKKLEETVSEFLSFDNTRAPSLVETNLTSLFQQVLLIVKPQLNMNNIEIIYETQSNLPSIHCDQAQIKQVFIRILQNAIEAMPDGGTIKVQILSKGMDHITIRFIDQGIGISEERMKRIGEPFYSTKEKGTGLGLLITHKIVEEHGGRIDINSVLNQGTTVDVMLPVNI
ncbi:EAL domain-containing protein [Neobacillus kokaensis]|uniref:histidine kinase n=1 Tax=Neobacillus kokaensis TaxID=2759023 RepID=A0ABQ3N5Z2_9BACI|nr:EAL domain-containing protein [Neobacillus kokaensis]GHH99471.1 hypothetical protein AM1BK_30140 [Neobacillus kokaensis]